MNYKLLPLRTPLFEYEELSDIAKITARYQVIISELGWYDIKISEYKALIKADIHVLINNKNHIRKIINKKAFLNKILYNLSYTEKFIIGNLCQFTSDGEYITYSS